MGNENTQHTPNDLTNEGSTAAASGSVSALDRVRDFIAKANPNIVPELITGATIDELLDSVPAAEAAYAQIAERFKNAATKPPTEVTTDAVAPTANPPAAEIPGLRVPTGSTPVAQGAFVDIEKLAPSELISRGIQQRRQQGN